MKSSGYRKSKRASLEAEMTKDKDLEAIFDLIKDPCDGRACLIKIAQMLNEEGLETRTDPRLKMLRTMMTGPVMRIGLQDFKSLVEERRELIFGALAKALVVPNFQSFAEKVRVLFDKEKSNVSGKVSKHVPLAGCNDRVSSWTAAVCSVDGQKLQLGDTEATFTLQSASKPFIYALAMDLLGFDVVHKLVGHEASNYHQDDIVLDSKGLPHNPMTNAGAIVVCSLLQCVALKHLSHSEEHEYIVKYLKELSGGGYIQFNNTVYIFEREKGDQNRALGHYLNSLGILPCPHHDIDRCLEFYFEMCSMEVSCESLCSMGATLANGGVCPTTGKVVLKSQTVKSVLSLMETCGMYNFSGQFLFEVGLPAKASASGSIVTIVPGVLAVATYSPRLDETGNSVRGLHFVQAFSDEMRLHPFADVTSSLKRRYPRRRVPDSSCFPHCPIFNTVISGNVFALNKLLKKEIDARICDDEGHTILHLAATKGLLDSVKSIAVAYPDLITTTDKWGRTPSDYAKYIGRDDILAILDKYKAKC